ncbi:hypothetical protein CHO01_28630 [Cellulomonas hominis]|uniref:Nitrate reductase delta subunit n=1 Tax=Cellulomonas hominis TaxID=156981 RepID=A0A511FHE1_9CELL|nr:nitrate reductase molybdenum cofactor assembly chaperone [Cellulomonas hominis]MBB5473906.1 nitrate reductase delta subunit [Cellulomonas hominis]NKY09777.1 nitrate reductase molybdenum cofactor assembly chaperone [Cellulomonas hominis]GEL47747.1 hypothetical protein CHO01_28630 [Cellulomonas hominis]
MNRVHRAALARRLATPEHAVVHRAAALLLEYPTPELLDLLPTVRAALTGVRPALAAPLLRAADHLASVPLPRLAADYVATFDLRRRCSLYLTYYAYGDTRRRGVALVEVKQAYQGAGFELAGDELPDHLAVVLELAGTGDAEGRAAGIGLLLAHRAGLELLRLALLDAGSPWADVLVAVSATLPDLGDDDRAAVAKLAAEGPPDEEVGLDPYTSPRTASAPPTAAMGAAR